MDQWQEDVDGYYRNFYVRHPEYLDALPEQYRSNIAGSLRGVRHYSEMAFENSKKAEELVGGEAAIDEILRTLFTQEPDPQFPYLTYQNFLDACGLTERRSCTLGNLFCYELRRLLNSKLLVGILLICLGYGWLTPHPCHRAGGLPIQPPFSPWSFGHYLSRLLPFLCSGELLFDRPFSLQPKRRVRAIHRGHPDQPQTIRRPSHPRRISGNPSYTWQSLALCVGFYAFTFGETSLGSLVCPAPLTPAPMAFCLGAGLEPGRPLLCLAYGADGGCVPLSWCRASRPWTSVWRLLLPVSPLILEVLDPAHALHLCYGGGFVVCGQGSCSAVELGHLLFPYTKIVKLK